MANSRNQKELENILDVLETFNRYSEVDAAPIIAKGIEKIVNTPANLVLPSSSSGGGEGGNTSTSHLLLLEAQNALFRSLGAVTREIDLDVGGGAGNDRHADGDRAGGDTSSSALVGVHTRHAAKLIEYVKTICQKDRVNMQGKAANVTVALESAVALIGRQRTSPSLIHLTALPHPVKSNDISARLAAIRFVPCLNGIASGSGGANHVYTVGGAGGSGAGGGSSCGASALRYQYQLGGSNGSSSSLSSFYTSPAVGEGATTAIFNEEVFVYLLKGLEGKDFRIRDACLKALNKGTVYYNLMFSPSQCAKLLEFLPRVADDTSATSNEAAEDCGQILGLALSAIAKSKIHTFCLLNNGGGVAGSASSASSPAPSTSASASIFANHQVVLTNVLAPILHFFTLQFSSLIMTRRRQTMLAVALGGLLASLKIAPSSAVQPILDHHHQVAPQTFGNTATVSSSIASNVFSSTAVASFLMSHLLAPTASDEKVYGPRLFSRAFQVWASTSSSSSSAAAGSTSAGIETEDDWQSFGKFLSGKLKLFVSLSVAIGGKRGTQAVVSAAVGGDGGGGASLTSLSPNAAGAGGGVTSSTSSIASFPQHHNSGGTNTPSSAVSTLFTIGSSFPVHTLSIPPHTVAQHRNAALSILHAIGTFSRGANLFSLQDLSQMANAAMQVLLLQVLQQQHHHHAASSPSPHANSLFSGNGSTPTNGAPLRSHTGGANSAGAGTNGNSGGSLVSLHTAASEALSEILRSSTTGFGFAVHHKLYEFCGQCLDLGLTHPLLLALRALSYSPYQYPNNNNNNRNNNYTNKTTRFVARGPTPTASVAATFTATSTNMGTMSTTASGQQDGIRETMMNCSPPPPPPPAPEVGFSLYFSILKSLSPSANITDKRIELFHLAAAAIIESLDSKRTKTGMNQNKNGENVRGVRKGGGEEEEENDVDDDGHILADTCRRYIVPNAMTHLTYLSQKANTSSRTYNNNHNNNANDSVSVSTAGGGGGAAAVPAGTWRAVAAVAKTLLLISKKKILCGTSPASLDSSSASSSPFGFDEVMVSHLLLWAVTGTIASASATTLKGLIAVAELAAHIVTTSSFFSAQSALISAMGTQTQYRSNNGTTVNRNHHGLGVAEDEDNVVFDEFTHHVPSVSSPTRIAFEARAAHKKRREAEAISGLVELGSAGHEERHQHDSTSSPLGHVSQNGGRRGDIVPLDENQVEKEKPSADALDAFDSFFEGCGGERKAENSNQGGGKGSSSSSSSAAAWGARSSISVSNIGGNLLNSVVLEFGIRAAQRAIDVFLFASRENIPCVVGGGFGVDLVDIDAEGEYTAENHLDDSGNSSSRDREGDEEDHFFDRSTNQPTRGEDWGELLFGPSPATSGLSSRLQRPSGLSPKNDRISSPSSEIIPPPTYASAVLRNYNAIIPASLAQQAYAALLRRNSKIFSQLTNVKAVASEIDSTGTDLPTTFLHNALATAARLASLRDGGSHATAVSSSASTVAASATGGSVSVVVEDVPAFNLLIFAHDKLKSLSALIEKQILQREAQKEKRRRRLVDSTKKLTQQQQQQQQQKSKEASWRRSKLQDDIYVASAVLVNATMTRQSAFGWSEAIKLAMGQSLSVPIRMLGEQCLRQLSALVALSEMAEGSIAGSDTLSSSSSQQPSAAAAVANNNNGNNNNNNHSLAFTSVLLSTVLENEKEKSLTVDSQRQPSPTPTSSNPASPLYLSAEREAIVRISKMALASLFIPSLHSFSSADAINNTFRGYNSSSQVAIATNAMTMANPARVIEVCGAVLRSFCAESPIALTVAHHCLRAIIGSLEAHAVVSCNTSLTSSSSSSAPSAQLSQVSNKNNSNSFSSLFLDKCLPSLWLLRFDPLVDLLICDILLLSNKIDESHNNNKEREEKEKSIRRRAAATEDDDSFFENGSRHPQPQGATSAYRVNRCDEDDERDRELRMPVVSANFFNSQEEGGDHNNGLEEREEIVSSEAKLMTYLALSKAAEGLGSNTCSFAGSAATSVASLDAGGYSFLAKLSNNLTNSVSGVSYVHNEDKNEEQSHRDHLRRMQGYNAFNGGISGSGYCCMPRYAPPSLIESVIAPFLFDSIRDEDIGTPLCDGGFILGIAQSLISRQSSSSSTRPLRIDLSPASLPRRLPNPRFFLRPSSPPLTPATGRMFLNLLLSHSWRVLANPNEPFLPALEAVLVPAGTTSAMAALRGSGSGEEENENKNGSGGNSFLHDLRDALTGRSRSGGGGGVGGGGAPPAVGAIITKALVMSVCIELFEKLLGESNALKIVLTATTTAMSNKNNNVATQNQQTTASLTPPPPSVAAAAKTVAPSDGLDMFGEFSSPSLPSSSSENVMFTADPPRSQGQGGPAANVDGDDDDGTIYSSHHHSPHNRKRQHHLGDPTSNFPTSAGSNFTTQARARKISNVLPTIWEILISALQLADSHHLLTTIATDCVLRMLRAHKRTTALTNNSNYDHDHHHEPARGNKQQQQSGAPNKALVEVEQLSAFLANPSRLKELLPTIKSICDTPSPDVRVLDAILATSTELVVVSSSSPTSNANSSSSIVNPPTPADVLKRLIACGIASLKVSNIRIIMTSAAATATTTTTTSTAAATSSPLLSLQMSAVNLIVRCVNAAALNASLALADTSSSSAAVVAIQGGARKHNGGLSQLQKQQQQQQYMRVVTDFCAQLNDGVQQQPLLAGLVAALAQSADILTSSLMLLFLLSGEQHKKDGVNGDNSSRKNHEQEGKLPITGMLIPVDPTAMIAAYEKKIFAVKEAEASSSCSPRSSPLFVLLSAFSQSIIFFFDHIAPHLNPAVILSYHPAIPDMLAIHIKTVVLMLASSLCCKSCGGKQIVEEKEEEEVIANKSPLPLFEIPLRLIEVVFGANNKALPPSSLSSPTASTTQHISRKISLAKFITASALRVAAARVAVDDCDENSEEKETKNNDLSGSLLEKSEVSTRRMTAQSRRFIMDVLQAVCSLVERGGEECSGESSERRSPNSVTDLPFEDHLRSLLITPQNTDSSKDPVATTSSWYKPLILELLMALNTLPASYSAQVSGKRNEQDMDLNSSASSLSSQLDSDVTTVVQALFLAAPSLPVAFRLGTEMKIFSNLSTSFSLATPNSNHPRKTVVMSVRKAVGEMSERIRQVYSTGNNSSSARNNRGDSSSSSSSTTASTVFGESVKLMIDSFVSRRCLHKQSSNFNNKCCELSKAAEVLGSKSDETFDNNDSLLFSFAWLFSWADEVRCGGGGPDLITGNGSLISLLGSWIERLSFVAADQKSTKSNGVHDLSIDDHREDDVGVLACSSLGAMSATIQAFLLVRDLSSFGFVSPLETILRTAFILQEQNHQQHPQQQSFCLTPQVMLLAIALHNTTTSSAPSSSTRTETLLSVVSQPMRELLQYGARHHTPAFKAVASKLGETNNEVLKACLTGAYAVNTPSMGAGGVGAGVSPSGVPVGNRLSSNAYSTSVAASSSSTQTTSTSTTVVSLPPPPPAGGRLKINLGAFK